MEPRERPRRADRLDVDTMSLILLLHLMDRWCNVIALCKAVIQHLDGADFVIPSLRPRSPIGNEQKRLANEDATEDDVDQFLNR